MAFQDRPLSVLTDVHLKNILMSVGEFRRLVWMVIELGHSVKCVLDDCTIEPEVDVRQVGNEKQPARKIELAEELAQLEFENANQPALQTVAQQPSSSDYTKHIKLNRVTMSAGGFRHLIWMVIQPGRHVKCMLDHCTIDTEPDVMNELTWQMPASIDHETNIYIYEGTISAEAFIHLIMQIQSGYSTNCRLQDCKIRPWENVKRLLLEMENQPAFQMMTPQPASPGYTTCIELSFGTISTEVLRHLVSMVIQWKQSVNLQLKWCTTEPEKDVRQNQVALEKLEKLLAFKMGAAQPVLSDYTTRIELKGIWMSPGVFGRFIPMSMHSGHSVNWNLNSGFYEIYENLENMIQLQGNKYNQPEFQTVDQQPALTDYTTVITFNGTFLALDTFRHLVHMVMKSHYLIECEPWFHMSFQFKQLIVEIRNRPAIAMVAPQPSLTNCTTHITMNEGTMAEESFRWLFTMVIHSQHDVDCKLDRCTIMKKSYTWRVQKQPDLQMVAQQSPNFTKHITLTLVTMPEGVFRCLVGMVTQSRYPVNCRFNRCIIGYDEEEGKVMKLTEKMESQPALEMVAHHPASTDLKAHITLDSMAPHPASTVYTTHIAIHEGTMSAGVFRRLVDILIQSKQSVDCDLQKCTIEPVEDLWQLEEEMANQFTLKVTEFCKPTNDHRWCIKFNVNV